jgi:hypothetical protein
MKKGDVVLFQYWNPNLTDIGSYETRKGKLLASRIVERTKKKGIFNRIVVARWEEKEWAVECWGEVFWEKEKDLIKI